MAGIPVNMTLRLEKRTADPTSPEEGDIWYRTDLGQIHAHDGAVVVPVGPRATHPFINTLSWHNLPPFGAAATQINLLNQAYALPFVPGRECTLTDMAINITLLGLGNVRGGFYNANQVTGFPSTLISDFGTISTGLAGQKTWSALSVSLKPILYYAVIVQQGVVATYSARTGWDPIISESAGSGPQFGQERAAYTQTGITGALPASFGTPAGTAQAPSVFLKLT